MPVPAVPDPAVRMNGRLPDFVPWILMVFIVKIAYRWRNLLWHDFLSERSKSSPDHGSAFTAMPYMA